MAYRDGKWITDREQRKLNEQKWAKVGVGPKHNDDLKADRQAVPAPVPLLPGMPGFTRGPQIDRPIIEGGCVHDGKRIALRLTTGTRLYPAKALSLKDWRHLDLIIDCAALLQSAKPFVQTKSPARWRALNKAAMPEVMTLHWPDMTAPTGVPFRFWARLHAMLPKHVGVCCMGAHGRTGTALAALLVADGVGGQDAIDRVRKEHCARAIETKEQEAYIRGLADERDQKGGR